jgi:hypothetical protein
MKIKSFLAALALIVAAPLAASGQSALDTSAAANFLGTWSLTMDSPQGAFVMGLEVTDAAGKVAAAVGAPELGGMQDVTDISLSGADLVLLYSIDVQGQTAPIALTLTPDGAELNVSMDFADGMFVMMGRGAK